MLLEVATALNLDLQRSLLIGDRLSDPQAGAAESDHILPHAQRSWTERPWLCSAVA